MISIRVEHLTKRFGTMAALRDIDLQVEPGELFFLLGPSGCGKTTLLRCLAGFHAPDAGRVLFDDEDVTRLAPHRRNTGMMFQSYALWPHMTVAENVAFGLEERNVKQTEIKRRVAAALESVHMGAQEGRRPDELSGGQQQRVALARALVIRPRCLLLDEPLSNLDAKLRLELRAEIRRVCHESKLTAVYVTHDQKEALSMADRIAVLDAGQVLQVGTPRDVYRRPRNRAVAHFIGETDFIDGRVVASDSGTIQVATSAGRFEGIPGNPDVALQRGDAVTLSVRPECWTLSRDVPARNGVRGVIGDSVYLGDVAQHDFRAGELSLSICELNPRFVGGAGRGEWWASAAPADVVVLAS